jgi:hypothetical protein
MKKQKLKKYLYLIPMVICVIFLYLFIDLEASMNRRAFDNISTEKHHWFNKLYEVAPLFQTEDTTFTAIAEGRLPIEILYKYAFIPYEEIVMEIIDAPFTTAIMDEDKNYIDSIIPYLKQFNFNDFPNDTTLTYYDSELGYANVFVYKTPKTDRYWVFRVTDGKMIEDETKHMALLVTFLMAITTIINLYYVYKYNNAETQKK